VTAGSALGWTSPAQPKLEAGAENEGWIVLSSEETSWIGSLTPAGSVIGPILVGLLADRIGRKWTLLFTVCPALVSWIMIVFVDTLVPIYVARFILGIAVGMVYAVVPMYVGEISEVSRPHSSLRLFQSTSRQSHEGKVLCDRSDLR
jgi:SP family facilitated glucose transporter-like MFS transporter 8